MKYLVNWFVQEQLINAYSVLCINLMKWTTDAHYQRLNGNNKNEVVHLQEIWRQVKDALINIFKGEEENNN